MGHRTSRRDFLSLMAASCLAVTFTPFVEWGRYLPNPSWAAPDGKTGVTLGKGAPANVCTFPVNHPEVVVNPESGDPAFDRALSHVATDTPAKRDGRLQERLQCVQDVQHGLPASLVSMEVLSKKARPQRPGQDGRGQRPMPVPWQPV